MTIKVNKQDWNALSATEQNEISSIIGSHFTGETIEATDDGTAIADVGGFCTLICNAAQAGATALCGRLTNPTAKQVCIVAAHAAGDLCRSKC
jgi:hypothetical protein